jgi:hypothetical protein
MDRRVPVNFGGGGLEDLSADALGKSQHVDGAVDTGFHRLDRIFLIVDGGGRTGKIVDLIHLNVEGKTDIMPHQLKTGIAEQMAYITFASGIEIIHAHHIITAIQQFLTEFGT